jgi:alkylated DNA repair protein alkB family protein 8
MNPSCPPNDPERCVLASQTVPTVLRDDGLVVVSHFLSPAEEAVCMEHIESQPWDSTLSRRTQHYGRRFDYQRKSVGPIDDELSAPIPVCIQQLVHKLCSSALVPWSVEPSADLQHSGIQVTVNEYRSGVGIASHVDTHTAFTDGIASVTLGAGSAFRMQRPADGADLSVWLAPRSLLVMSRAARYAWRHSISGRKYDRVACLPGQRSQLDAFVAENVIGADCLLCESADEMPVEANQQSSDWFWVARARRVSVTIRQVQSDGQCSCAWPLLCDGQANGPRLQLPTRLPTAGV